MATIGDYKTRVVIMRYSASTDTSFGGRQPGYEDDGEAWASVDETGGGRRVTLERKENQADASIRVRGFPLLASNDRLREKESGYVWRVEGVRRGKNELICEAFRVTDSER